MLVPEDVRARAIEAFWGYLKAKGAVYGSVVDTEVEDIGIALVALFAELEKS